jgi:hypothetical protein
MKSQDKSKSKEDNKAHFQLVQLRREKSKENMKKILTALNI